MVDQTANVAVLHQRSAEELSQDKEERREAVTAEPKLLSKAASSSCSSSSLVPLLAGAANIAPSDMSSALSVGGTNQLLPAMIMDDVSFLLREQDAELLERQESQLPNDDTPNLCVELATDFEVPDFMLPPPMTLLSSYYQDEATASNALLSHAGSHSNHYRSSNDANQVEENQQRQQSLLTLPWSISHPGVEYDRLHYAAADIAENRSSATLATTCCTEHTHTTGDSDHNSWHTGGEELIATLGQQEQCQRPTLGGQVFCEQRNYLSHEKLRSVFNPSTSQTASSNSCDRITATSHSLSTNNDCSLMVDRRLAEAAQFAEAIGDSKVAADLLILEEDLSDDDDDDGEVRQKHHRGQHADIVANTNKEMKQVKPMLDLETHFSAEADDKTGGTNFLQAQNPSNGITDVARASRYPNGRGGLLSSRFLQARHIKRLATKRVFLDQLPACETSGQSDYVYKGLLVNPPEVVKRGTQRGNYAQLHRKAWLEVSDKYHRYGKNLRVYYRHWESLGCPTNMFFDWLDSKGEAAGQPLPELAECPRAQLDADTVLYITDPEVTEHYALTFVPDENGRGRVLDVNGEPVTTGPDGWIFVLRDNRMYGAQKITSVIGQQTKERFHHSSFFGGKAVAAAGIFITDDDTGLLTRLYPHSGHYRPGEAHVQRVLFFLHQEGVDLRTFDIDMQQILHVARDKDMLPPKGTNDVSSKNDKSNQDQEKEEGEHGKEDKNAINNSSNVKIEKKKKVESLYLTPAVLMASFLAHKARMIGAGFFEQIHQIRKSNVTTVREALDLIEGRGT